MVNFNSEATQKYLQLAKLVDCWEVTFQKFTFLKLTLRLLTELTDSSYSRHLPKIKYTTQYDEHCSSDELDELATCQAQLNHLIDSSCLCRQMTEPLLLKVRPPFIQPKLDLLVTTLAAIAKIHVASVIFESLKYAKLRQNKEHTTQKLIFEPRDVYEALQKTTFLETPQEHDSEQLH